MNDRVSISSIMKFIELAREKPSLLTIGNFSLLQPVMAIKGGCSCKTKPGQDIGAYRPQFEAAMAMLTDNDKLVMKAALDTKQVCYYQKNAQGQLKQICF